jgi:long-chain acyl-CoA synthetase
MAVNTLTRGNLAKLAEDAIERHGDYDSMLFEARWYRSADMFERGRRIAGGLASLGVAPGDRVVVSMANCPEVPIAYQALWRAGAVVTPVSFLLPAPELRHVIADSEAVAVITTPEFVDKVLQATEGLPNVRFVVCHGDAPRDLIPLASLEESGPLSIVDRADDDLAALLYTGGTTGRAKGVMLSHANLFYSSHAGYEESHVEGLSRFLHTLPLSHSYGLGVTISSAFYTERPVAVLLRWFDASTFLDLVQSERIELSGVVPSMLQRLLGEDLESRDLSTLRYMICGGAPLAPAVAVEFQRRVPSCSIRQGYGLTETSTLISANPPGRERAGSVGLPVPGTTVVIVDDDGKELPRGESGEICASSPGVMLGYWRSPEVTAETVRNGRCYTGDIGYLDEDGYLYVVDRKKDLIIRGGFNVYPRDVEDALMEHPEVAAAGVVGRPDERSGEEVVAFVALGSGGSVTADKLIEWSKERLGGYKYPREIHIVETLPLTSVGKLDRKVLRAQVREA